MESADTAQIADHIFRDRALIEGAFTVDGDCFQSIGELQLAMNRTYLGYISIRKEYTSSIFVFAQ